MLDMRLMLPPNHESWVARIGQEPMFCHVLLQRYSGLWSHWEGPEFQKLCHLQPLQIKDQSPSVVQSHRVWWPMRIWRGVVVLKLILILLHGFSSVNTTWCIGSLVLLPCKVHIYPKSTNVIFVLYIFNKRNKTLLVNSLCTPSQSYSSFIFDSQSQSFIINLVHIFPGSWNHDFQNFD